MGNKPGTHAGCVGALTTLTGVGAAVVIFNPIGLAAVCAVTAGATLGPPACIVAGLLYDNNNDKRKAADREAEEAASQAERRRAEERQRQEARRQEEERQRQEARRQEEERQRQEARRQEVERQRQEARRQEEERQRQEARRQEEERQRQEARRQEVERQRQEARRQEEERARQEARRQEVERQRQEARLLEEERARQEARRQEVERQRQEARRQEVERQRQEARRLEEERQRQEARRLEEERQRQEAIARCIELINHGVQVYREGWEAEKDCNSKLAAVKFQNSYDKFDEACMVDPSNARSVEWRKVCRLKITGNVLFNKGLESQEKGDHEAALVQLKEAKIAFHTAWSMNGDTGFQECIVIVNESVEATNEALHEANRGQIQIGEREIRTERGDGQRLVGVVDHFFRRC